MDAPMAMVDDCAWQWQLQQDWDIVCDALVFFVVFVVSVLVVVAVAMLVVVIVVLTSLLAVICFD